MLVMIVVVSSSPRSDYWHSCFSELLTLARHPCRETGIGFRDQQPSPHRAENRVNLKDVVRIGSVEWSQLRSLYLLDYAPCSQKILHAAREFHRLMTQFRAMDPPCTIGILVLCVS